MSKSFRQILNLRLLFMIVGFMRFVLKSLVSIVLATICTYFIVPNNALLIIVFSIPFFIFFTFIENIAKKQKLEAIKKQNMEEEKQANDLEEDSLLTDLMTPPEVMFAPRYMTPPKIMQPPKFMRLDGVKDGKRYYIYNNTAYWLED